MQKWAAGQISMLKENDLLRFLKTIESDQGPEVVCGGRKLLNFSSNNYLGLANHPALKKEAIRAVEKFGTGSGASRLITGSMSLHEDLEKKIASFKGTESALVFNSGYHANIGLISSLAGEGDLIFSDALNHASLIDGCRLSRAETKVYRHGDVGHLETILLSSEFPPPLMGGVSGETSARRQKANRALFPDARSATELAEGAGDPEATLSLTLPHQGGGKKRLIITDTVFSMDGDLAPLPEIVRLAEKYDSWVLVDEAHATGVFGKKGRGLIEHFGIDSQHPRLIQMGTLGKALGSFGAYVCGPRVLIDFLINRARSFIYTTSLPPAVVGASIAAIDLISEDTSLRDKLWENVKFFSQGLSEIFNLQSSIFNHQSPTPIFPIIIGDSKKTMEVAEKLFDAGIWAHGIRPPTVPEGTARIRLTLMATHTREHLDRCLEALADVIPVPRQPHKAGIQNSGKDGK